MKRSKIFRGLTLVLALAAPSGLSAQTFGPVKSGPPFLLPSNPQNLTTSHAYTTLVGDVATCLTITSGPGNATVTLLAAATAGNGAVQCIRKVDNAGTTITGVADNGSGLCRLTVGSTTNIATGEIHNTSGIGGAVECNGQSPITVVDATHIDLQDLHFVAGDTYTSSGTISGGRVTVSDGGDRAWLQVGVSSTPQWSGDVIYFQSDGSAWNDVGHGIQPQIWLKTFNGVYTWIAPPLSTAHDAFLVGSGAGGGSGRSGAAGAARFGGGGGASGFTNIQTFTAAQAGTSQTVTVGAGGTGGPASTTNDGQPGGNSNPTIFGSLAQTGIAAVQLPTGGSGGTATTGTGGVGGNGSLGGYANGNGGASSGTATAGGGGFSVGTSGGGAGGGITSGNAALAAGNGAQGGTFSAGHCTQGIGGANTGVAGTKGGPSNDINPTGACGGGGGGANATAGFAGGGGGWPGGGGGGGSASLNANASGPGGTGADGMAWIRSRF